MVCHRLERPRYRWISLLRRGLADSALPLIPRILRWSEWIRFHAGPAYVSVLRIWLAAASLVIAPHVMRRAAATSRRSLLGCRSI